MESATRALVKSLGSLSARELVYAEAAFSLAAALDSEPDGNKAAALSRELRIVVATLTPAAGVVPKAGPSADPVQKAQDEVAARRARRAAK